MRWQVIGVRGRGGKSHATIVKKICCGRVWRTLLTCVMLWCGWRNRSIGNSSTEFLDRRFFGVCPPRDGRPPLPRRRAAGLPILKHMHRLSDEALCARWLKKPYYQFFCGS